MTLTPEQVGRVKYSWGSVTPDVGRRAKRARELVGAMSAWVGWGAAVGAARKLGIYERLQVTEGQVREETKNVRGRA